MKWAVHVTRVEKNSNVHRTLVGKPEGWRLIGRPRRRWEDNIKINVTEMVQSSMEWIHLAHDRD
jgi:hypothetical protein